MHPWLGMTALIQSNQSNLSHGCFVFPTAFLSFLCIYESWLTELSPLGDVIALRFLLFLSYTYGMVLFLTAPLIAVETLTRLLWPHSVVAHRAVSQTVDSNGQRCYAGEVTVEEKENRNNQDQDKGLSHVVGYLCCLSVWVVVALNVRWRWKLEEEWAAACLHTTNSLIRCLPNLSSTLPSAVNPCWGMAFLSLLLLLLTMSTGLPRRRQAPECINGRHRAKNGVNSNTDSCWPEPVQAQSAPSKPVNLGMSMSEPAQRVDPEKTESSCAVHGAYSWNILQMSARHHGDFVLISPGGFSAEKGGQEHERTKRGIPLTFIMEEHADSQYRSQPGGQQWGFPCLGVNVMIGFVVVLSIFVLPLNLSVNILLIRTIETLLELCVRSLVSSAANTSDKSASHNETFV